MTFTLNPDGTISNVNSTVYGGTAADEFDVVLPATGAMTETITDDSGNGSVVLVNGSQNTTLGGGLSAGPQTDTWTDASGTQYTYTPDAAGNVDDTGTLTITGGSLDAATAGNQITLENFNLALAEDPNNPKGFLGIKLPQTLQIAAGATDGTGSASGSPTMNEGDSQSFTISTATPSSVAQTVTLALSGASAADFAVDTGKGDLVQFNANGTLSLTIPAGEDSAAYSLLNTGDLTSPATLQLTASINASGTKPISSNILNIAYAPGTPDPFTNPTITGAATQTAINDQHGGNFLYNLYQGDGGNDAISTGKGPNAVDLGGGSDIVNAGSSQDAIGAGGSIPGGSNPIRTDYAGGNGNNVIALNGHTDLVAVGGGNNRIYGNTQTSLTSAIAQANIAGNATGKQGALLTAGDGNNTLVGSNGNDLLMVGAGNNEIVAGPGSDTILG
ncbi:MAG: hypothetical protein ACRDQZ_18595, partial [Mycobacteriales bacterium]